MRLFNALTAAVLAAGRPRPALSRSGRSRPHVSGKRATIVGTSKAEKLVGTPRRDGVVGRGGDDMIKGRGGDDVICGGKGADTLHGGLGEDRLYGQGEAWDDDRGGAYFTPDLRRAALLVPVALVVGAVATASWAAPVAPIPVKDNPNVTETAPSAHGRWFGWAMNSQRKPDHYDFYVQRGTEARVKVNAAGTQGLGGDIAGRGVFYVQKFRDRDPRINRFDLRSGLRSRLPAKVNHHRHTVKNYYGDGPEGNRVVSGVRGDVTVSGPWLLYSGYMEFLDYDVYRYHTVMLYNRVTHRLRQVAAISSEFHSLIAGQVNGKYVTYLSTRSYGVSCCRKAVVRRYNIKTGRTVKLSTAHESLLRSGPSVGSDGTVYFFKTDADCTDPCTHELVRRPIGGPAEVIANLTTQQQWQRPYNTYVKDRPDSSRLVLFSSNGDIYKVVDGPETTAASG